jgi:hypothetical protein
LLLTSALAVAGAALVVVGFFLPWVEGAAEFGARDFSGFDLARLVRNFEVVASSSAEAGRDRATALILYAMPALAVNGAVLALLPVVRREAVAVATGVAAAYAVVILAVVAVLSSTSWTELERVLGPPMSGFFASLVGSVLLGASSALTFRGSGAASRRR